MNKNLFKLQEIAGLFFTVLMTCLMWNIYELSDRSLAGALFGSVNHSIWEQAKPLLLCYIFYGLIEITTSKPFFKQFIVAKFVGLYAVLLSYIALRSLFSSCFNDTVNLLLTIFSLFLGFLLSYKLTMSDYPLKNLFPTSCFMILLLFVICFSFTAFPPQGMLFVDPVTNLYGIVPDFIDVGAIVLDKSYF